MKHYFQVYNMIKKIDESLVNDFDSTVYLTKKDIMFLLANKYLNIGSLKIELFEKCLTIESTEDIKVIQLKNK